MQTANAAVVVAAEGISLTYAGSAGNRVLHQVNFSVREGEVIGVVGRSGAGKTSLLAALAGQLPLASGAVRFGPLLAAKGGLRAIIQGDAALERDGSLAACLGCNREVGRLSEGLEALLALLDLEQAWRTPLGRLPQTLQDRAALARAFFPPVGLLLLDELPGLDRDTAARLARWLPGWARATGMAVVLGTRSPTVAAAICDRAIVLSAGRVAADEPVPVGIQIAETRPARYRVRLRGQLDPARSDWFAGWDVNGEGEDTVLTGEARDQPALHGLLARVRDLGLPLIALERLEDSFTAKLTRFMDAEILP